MSRPNKITLDSTSFDTLKNDGRATGTVTIPGSVSITAGNSVVYTSDVTIGDHLSVVDVRVRSHQDGTQYYLAGANLRFTRNPGTAFPYDIYVNAYHVSEKVVRLQAYIFNPYFLTMITNAPTETFSFELISYKTPFS